MLQSLVFLENMAGQSFKAFVLGADGISTANSTRREPEEWLLSLQEMAVQIKAHNLADFKKRFFQDFSTQLEKIWSKTLAYKTSEQAANIAKDFLAKLSDFFSLLVSPEGHRQTVNNYQAVALALREVHEEVKKLSRLWGLQLVKTQLIVTLQTQLPTDKLKRMVVNFFNSSDAMIAYDIFPFFEAIMLPTAADLQTSLVAGDTQDPLKQKKLLSRDTLNDLINNLQWIDDKNSWYYQWFVSRAAKTAATEVYAAAIALGLNSDSKDYAALYAALYYHILVYQQMWYYFSWAWLFGYPDPFVALSTAVEAFKTDDASISDDAAEAAALCRFYLKDFNRQLQQLPYPDKNSQAWQKILDDIPRIQQNYSGLDLLYTLQHYLATQKNGQHMHKKTWCCFYQSGPQDYIERLTLQFQQAIDCLKKSHNAVLKKGLFGFEQQEALQKALELPVKIRMQISPDRDYCVIWVHSQEQEKLPDYRPVSTLEEYLMQQEALTIALHSLPSTDEESISQIKDRISEIIAAIRFYDEPEANPKDWLVKRFKRNEKIESCLLFARNNL